MNYYCFVAGSKDLSLDMPKGTPTMIELLEEYEAMLSSGDSKLFYLLRLAYDNANLLALLKDKEAKLSDLGNIDQTIWLEALPQMGDSEPKEIYKEFGIEEYLTEFYQRYASEEEKMDFPENHLYSLYYKRAMTSGNTFLKNWFEYNLNLNNVVSAMLCKKYGWDITKNIVGEGEIVETIKNNQGSKDFGLVGVYDDIDIVMGISEQKELIDQEKKYDALRWAWLDENTFFSTFSIEQVLAYWIKCEMIHRWDYLTIEEGEKVFKEILSELKQGIKF